MDTIHDEGWVKLHRKSTHSQVFQTEGLWKAWTWCLMKANHKDVWIPVKTGRGETSVLIKRGQFLFGRNSASKELRMKPPTVQYRMKCLANMQNLIITNKTHFSIVTVCNYDLYQGLERNELSPTLSTNYQPTITNKNDKNNNLSGKKTPDPKVKEFLNWWGRIFTQETGQPYTFSYAKEGALVKRLLKVHSIETLQDMTRAFFRDDQCKRRGPSIGIFFQEINRLLSLKSMNPLEQARREILNQGSMN